MSKYTQYLPTNENQDYPDFSTYSCTNFSICNLFETYLNEMIGEKTMALDNVQWLNDNGYIDKYGSVNFSDQYNGILSGTKWGVGNYFEKVIDSVLRDGLIPDKLFTDTPHSPEEYYNAQITQKMRDTGSEFLKRFNIKVENKNAPIEAIKSDLLWITVNVGEGYGWKDPIPPSVMPPTHAVLGYGIDGDIVSFFDTYPEYRKRTAVQNVYAKWLISIKQNTMIVDKNLLEKLYLMTFKRLPDIEANYYIGRDMYEVIGSLLKSKENILYTDLFEATKRIEKEL